MSDLDEASAAMARGTMQQHRDTDEQVDWRNVNFNAPPSAPPHTEGKLMERLDHDQAQAQAENIRKAVQEQPTVEQGIAALFQAIATAIQNATEGGDPNGLVALARHINEDPRSWSDAVLANTQAAPLTAGPRVPEMPTHVKDAFKSHGTLQHDQQQAEEARRHDEQQQQQQPQGEPQAKQPDEPAHTAPMSRSEQARQRQDNEPAMKA